MNMEAKSYFAAAEPAATTRNPDRHQAALDRSIARLRSAMPVIGLRNPKIGTPGNCWAYCAPFDWVVSFYAGQLWLALQLTGDFCLSERGAGTAPGVPRDPAKSPRAGS